MNRCRSHAPWPVVSPSWPSSECPQSGRHHRCPRPLRPCWVYASSASSSWRRLERQWCRWPHSCRWQSPSMYNRSKPMAIRLVQSHPTKGCCLFQFVALDSQPTRHYSMRWPMIVSTIHSIVATIIAWIIAKMSEIYSPGYLDSLIRK